MTCAHPVTVVSEPEVREHCVNVYEQCTACGEPVAVTSYAKDEWIHRQIRKITDVQQMRLPRL